MGTVVRLPERTAKSSQALADVAVPDNVPAHPAARADDLAAVASLNDGLDRLIGQLRKCLVNVDRIGQLIDDGTIRNKYASEVKSIQASLMLGSIELSKVNRAVTTAILRKTDHGDESRPS